jgi:hypothetical protein
MMKTTVMRYRANHSGQAWPGQAIEAVLVRGSLRRFFQVLISSPGTMTLTGGRATYPQHRTRSSLPVASDPHPRSGRQSIPIAVRPDRLVQPIFRPPSRRPPPECSPSIFRREAGLKMLCIMFYTGGRQKGRIKESILRFLEVFWSIRDAHSKAEYPVPAREVSSWPSTK